jgi:hypothetical protein
MPAGLGLHTWSKHGPIKRLEHSTNERILSVEIGTEWVHTASIVLYCSSASIRNEEAGAGGHAFEFGKMHTSRILARKEFSLAG